MDKKFFIALTLSLVTVLGLQYFFSGKVEQKSGTVSVTQQPVAGQPIKVAATQDLIRPLDLNVKFEDKKIESQTLTSAETKDYKAVFSDNGATLISLEFKNYKGKKSPYLKTLDLTGADKSQGCFLLALQDKTPLQYQLLSKQDKTVGDQEVIEIAYKAETEFWNIQKTYLLYQDSYKIDLNVKFEPKTVASITPLRARVLLSSPYVSEIENNTLNVFIFNEAKEAIEKIDLATVQDLAWHWISPKAMIGGEDKYFVHSVVNDPGKFVQRAYFKKFDTKSVSTILEGPEISSAKDFNISFYMGPKGLDEMSAVDPRLVDLLSFGWLSWLCKLLLKLINWLYELIGNFGWAIVVMTILLRLPFIPLSIYSRKRMEEYQRFQPTIQRIRQKYKHDLRLQNEELVKFHQEHNLSTATPLLGCLPLLIQMPILFALYRVLGNYVDLYQAPFFGWIHDLAAKDPYYIIPVLMGLTMLWQQIITPAADEKQKIMMYFVSIVVTVLFASFPVGLVLYWTMNNILTLMEDYFRKYVLR